MVFKPVLNPPIRIVNPGIYILTGVVNVRVNHGQLILKAGAFDNQAEISLTKGTSKLTRLVVIGNSGTVSLAALCWLNDIKAGFVQIGDDDSVIVSSVCPGPDNPRLRRAQATARDTNHGLSLIKNLIIGKAAGQREVYNKLPGKDQTHRLDSLIDQLNKVSTFPQIRIIESQIASVYWERWGTVPILFARKDNHKTPDEWKTFGTRVSSLSNSPRKASGPANAILNYLYALLKAETRLACLIYGMDPGVGIFHADQPYRDSLVYDLMEPVRPNVDSYLLDMLSTRRFMKGDFYEEPSGQVKITRHLTHELVESMSLWAKITAPIVQKVASSLSRMKITPGEIAKTRKKLWDIKPGRSCAECGLPIYTQKRFCSDECRLKYSQYIPDISFTQAGSSTLKHLRSENTDPAHGGLAAVRRGQSNKARSIERKEWDVIHSPRDAENERDRFKTDILPLLNDYSLRQITNATSLSIRYASLIRSGQVTPHPCHYPRLDALIKPEG